jgi:predicted aspartyl protease
MLIKGEWLLCDDGVLRPVLRGEILAGNNIWEAAEFLIDTGADRTVFNAPLLIKAGLQANQAQEGIAGLGGLAASVIVTTQIRLTRETGAKVAFRGQYAAVTEVAALDMSVLGRDLLGLFAVIVDQPASSVCLLNQGHRYRIEQI